MKYKAPDLVFEIVWNPRMGENPLTIMAEDVRRRILESFGRGVEMIRVRLISEKSFLKRIYYSLRIVRQIRCLLLSDLSSEICQQTAKQ